MCNTDGGLFGKVVDIGFDGCYQLFSYYLISFVFIFDILIIILLVGAKMTPSIELFLNYMWCYSLNFFIYIYEYKYWYNRRYTKLNEKIFNISLVTSSVDHYNYSDQSYIDLTTFSSIL